MAAEVMAKGGARVWVHEAMPSPARKFLMAGRGGLNLTHSEPRPGFDRRYGEAEPIVASWLDAFSPDALMRWAEDLGQPLFVGASGRVFPRAMKASPLLRAWLARLADAGVEVRTRSRWTGWRDGALAFATAEGEVLERPDAVVLALGGASWPKLGSDAGWTAHLPQEALAPFRPANAGFNIDWSPVFADRFAGQPIKAAVFSHAGRSLRGEAMITRYGIEGGAVYALSAALRDAVAADGAATLTVDLKPDLTVETLAARLAKPRGGDSLSNWLRKAAGLAPVAIGLLRDIPGAVPETPQKLALRIKGVRLKLVGMQGLERAISSAGGVRFDAVDARLMLTARPGVFVAGEMLDWEAPTGGYLLQAGFASGVVAGLGALAYGRDRR